MSDSQTTEASAPYKTARAAELFWLVTSVVTTGYVLYLWWNEDMTRWTLGLFLASLGCGMEFVVPFACAWHGLNELATYLSMNRHRVHGS